MRGPRRTQLEIGARYGKLTVVSFSRVDAHRRAIWNFACACGNTKALIGSDVLRGNSRSCGCLVGQANVKHGHARRNQKTREYKSWVHMIQRCYDENFDFYHNYGGRGITVCARWRKSFEAFLADMGARPPRTSIDRIDNEGNYTPKNCRWATAKKQRINQRGQR